MECGGGCYYFLQIGNYKILVPLQMPSSESYVGFLVGAKGKRSGNVSHIKD